MNQPATKADIRRLEARMDGFEKRLDSFERAMIAKTDQLWKDIDRVIVLLGNIEKKLSAPVLDHERRITRLEEKFGLVS